MTNKYVLDKATYIDILQLVDIEYEIFKYPWEEKDFKRIIHESSNLVYRIGDKIMGYLFYSKNDEGGVEILNLGVKASHQRSGLGSALVARLSDFKTVEITVRERNVPAQLFLKKMGFVCDAQLKRFYDFCDDDAYHFIKNCMTASDGSPNVYINV